MSRVVDERVVEMSFDNKQFEKNVATSLNTLNNLKQNLKMDGASKGLENIGEASKKLNFSNISDALTAVTLKFSSLGTVSDQILRNVGNEIWALEKKFVSLIKSMSVDQVSAGWTKFGEKTGSVATLVSQGYELETVNEQLNRLNWFTDETSYNFTEMVKNIAKFTATGQDLETSVTAMEGIANWAALSGQNAQTASNAMYQLSQAMGSGIMRKEDYKSIQNASMDTAEFRQKAIDAAIALGTLKQNADGTYQSLMANTEAFTRNQFADHLTQDAWFTSDVMMKVFNEYSGAVDQIYEYAQTYGVTGSEAIEALGDSVDEFGLKAFRSAQEARTFADVIDSVKDAVSTGWMNSFELIFGDYEHAKTLWTNLANELWDSFAGGGETRNAILEAWQSFGGWEDLFNYDEDNGPIGALWNLLEAVRSVTGPIKEAFSEIFTPWMTNEDGNTTFFGLKIREFTKNIRDFTASLILGDDASDKLRRTFKGLFAVFDIVKKVATLLLEALSPLWDVVIDLGDGILTLTANFGDWLVSVDEAISENLTLQGVVEKVQEFLTNAIQKIKEFFGAAGEKIDTEGFSAFQQVVEKIQNGLDKLKEILGNVKNKVLEFFGLFNQSTAFVTFVELVNAAGRAIGRLAISVGAVVKDVFGSVWEKITTADFSGLIDLFNGVAVGGLTFKGAGLLGSLKEFISSLTGGLNLEDLGGNITQALSSLQGILKSYQDELKAKTLKDIATAVAILAASLVVVSLIDSEKLLGASAALGMLFVELTAAASTFTTLNSKTKGSVKSIATLIAMSTSILLLAGSLKMIGSLPVEGIAAGTVAIVALLSMMVAVTNQLSTTTKNKKVITEGISSIIAFSVAIKILASAVKDLSDLDIESLLTGLAGVGVLIAEVSLFLKSTSKLDSGTKVSISIVALAASLKILASVCKDFAEMSWEDIAKGLTSTAALLVAIGIFAKATQASSGSFKSDGIFGKWSDKNEMLSIGVGLIALATAMKIFASAMSDMSELSWEEIAKGLVGVTGALTGIALAMKLMPQDRMISTGTGMIAMATSLLILQSALSGFGSLSWDEIARGLVAMAGALGLVVAALALINPKSITSKTAAITTFIASLTILAKVMETLGSMSWEDVIKSIVALAGTFGILTASVVILSNFQTTLIALGVSMALIGTGIALIGVGLLAAGTGLTAIAAGVAALGASLLVAGESILLFVQQVLAAAIGLIPFIFEQLALGVVTFLQSIAGLVSELAGAVKTIVLSIIDVLVECVPPLVDGILYLVTELLTALVEYTPTIVNLLFDFVICVLKGVAERIPELIVAVFDVLKSIFKGVLEAFGSIDMETLLQGIAAVGMITAIIAALSAVTPMIPKAMIGVIGLGALIAEFSLVLAAVGAIAKIPGLTWLIDEGANLLLGIGNAIGSFIGGIVGGVMNGVTTSLPKIGQDLSDFMTNLEPFIEGVGKLDEDMITSVQNLAQAVLVLTAAELLDGISSFISGGRSISNFGEDLVDFGKYLSKFYEKIKDVDGDVVKKSADAGLALAELSANLPRNGGVFEFFTGSSSLKSFAKELIPFGEAMSAYGRSIRGLNPDAVEKSANAAKTLSELASNLPDHGGVVQWFTGDSTLTSFAEELEDFGSAIWKYASKVKGIDNEAVTSSANAAMSLATLADNLPPHGGIAQWFTGDATLSDFAANVIDFGIAMKSYSEAIDGINNADVEASANAAMALAELNNNIPNSGGIISWFEGDNTLSGFADGLDELGSALWKYAMHVRGISEEDVESSANAAMALADLDSNLADHGGVFSWFTGDTTLSDFAEGLPDFGTALSDYATNIGDVDSSIVESSANAAKALAEVIHNLPETGGVLGFLNGDQSLSSFAEDLPGFGTAMNDYAKNIPDVNSESVTASANAAGALAQLAANIPAKRGPLLSWITGDRSLGTFAEDLVPFGKAMASYAQSVSGISLSKVNSSAYAAKALAEIDSNLKDHGGVVSLFKGDNSLGSFADELEDFGIAMGRYSDSIKDVKPETVTASASAAMSLAELDSSLSDHGGVFSWFTGDTTLADFGDNLELFGEALASFSDTSANVDSNNVSLAITNAQLLLDIDGDLDSDTGTNLSSFGGEIEAFGGYFAQYYADMSDINTSKLTAVVQEVGKLVDMAAGIEDIDTDAVSTFGESLEAMGADGVEGFISAFDGSVGEVNEATDRFINVFRDAIGARTPVIQNAFVQLITRSINIINQRQQLFVSAGSSVANRFIEGINVRIVMVNTIFTDILTRTLNTIKDDEPKFKTAANDLVKAFINGFSGDSTGIKSYFGTTISGVIVTIRSKTGEFNAVGQEIFKSFVNGVSKDMNSIKSKFASGVNAAKNGAREYRSDFYSTAVYLVNGFINGIDDNRWKSRSSGYELGRAAAEGARKALREASPSKEFYEIGDFAGIALVNALNDYSGTAFDSGFDLGSNAANGLSMAASKIAAMLDNEMDYQPTITPVLDLSEIQNGTSVINRMMGDMSSPFMGSSEMAYAAGSGLNRPFNSDLQTQLTIDALKRAVDKMSENPSRSFNNTFNITESTDPYRTADEISRILQQQVERKESTWA